jgi:hypothetical protein
VEIEEPSSKQIQVLKEALLPQKSDKDLVHEVFMSLPANAFAALARDFPEAVRDLTARFTDNVVASGWGFSYCDDIATAILRLYGSATDIELRKMFIVALGSLGVSHNRFFVIDCFIGLLEKLDDPGEILAIRDALKSAPALVSNLKVRLAKATVPIEIRRLVETQDPA